MGLYENPSGDKICWVGHAFKAGQEEAKTECTNRGFQGLAEARTEYDWAFMNMIDACNISVSFFKVLSHLFCVLLIQIFSNLRLWWKLY